MTKHDEEAYEDTESLREFLKPLKGRKFKLDCSHHVTFGHHLGNNVMIYNGTEYEIICSLCSY